MRIHFLLFVLLTTIGTLGYAQADNHCTEMLRTLDNILVQKVPELESLDYHIHKTTDSTGGLMYYIHHCPDPEAKDNIYRDYYELYVSTYGPTQFYKKDDHISLGRYRNLKPKPQKRMYIFFIKKDLTEILVYDTKEKTYQSVDKARQSENWKNTFELKKQWVDANLK